MEKKERKTMSSNRSTIEHGLISVIGRRRTMEDAFTVHPNLVRLNCNLYEHKHENEHEHEHENKKGKKQAETSYDFFAVFDGHGSKKVSDRCKERLHHLVADELTRVQGGVVDWKSVMAKSFARMDAEVAVALSSYSRKKLGSTALVVVVVGTAEIVVASFGDCRVVLFRDQDVLQLSRCRKVEKSGEQERMEAQRVNVSDLRSDAPLIPRPIDAEVEVCKRNALDDFIVIGTNGLWDVIENDVAGDMVRKCFRGQVSKTVLEGVGGNCAAAAATMLAELAIARGSRDNISVIVVQLRDFDANSSCFTK